MAASPDTNTSTASSGSASGGSGSTTYVNQALLPAAKPGYAQQLIRSTTSEPYADPDGHGAVRTVCDYSHFNFDDPLVYPGQSGKSHLHLFFGNAGIDASSASYISDLRSAGGSSTCRGGSVNLSGYWVPAMIDTSTGAPLVPINQDVTHGGIDVYYKNGYHGVANADVKPIPKGFRMIAGNSKSTGEQSNIQYACNDTGWSTSWKQCNPGDWFYMSVEFPQCVAVDNSGNMLLDSPDHKSHVAFATGQGCNNPAFPVALPNISYAIKYLVGPNGMSTWRLSSDIAGAPAGSSGHGDYVFGWDETIFDTAIRQIVNAGLSGGSDLVGNSKSIYWP